MPHALQNDPTARRRLRWIEHYEQVTKKVAPTCRYFGITRQTFYIWYHRHMSLGVEGLRSKSCRPHKIHRWLPKEIRDEIIQLRLQRKYGPIKMSIYLKQKKNWFVSKNSIWRLYKEHGLNRLGYKKKWERYPQRYSKDLPGDRVQIDVKYIEKMGLEQKRYYQFTAIDDCTRYRVLRVYDHNTVANATDFVNELQKKLPFAIKQIQTDNGSEFSQGFSWHLDDLGITHRKTKVCSPEENGKVERSHRTDGEVLWPASIRFYCSLHQAHEGLGTKVQRGSSSHVSRQQNEVSYGKLANHVSKRVWLSSKNCSWVGDLQGRKSIIEMAGLRIMSIRLY